MMGAAWHGSCFRYFEVTHEALLSQFNYDCRQVRESGYLQPVIDARVKYRHALTFEQRIRVRTYVEEFENRLRIGYQIFDTKTDKHATTGYTIQVAIEEQGRKLRSVSPNIPFERIGVKP